MPGRTLPLVTDKIYHIFNRGIAAQLIFSGNRDYQRAIDTIFYYVTENPPLRYSFFLRLSYDQKQEFLRQLDRKEDYLIDIIAYCLMPNHIHLLVKQLKDKGISTYMSKVSNSYTKYFNTKRKRSGPVLQGKFKAVRIETDEQLLHVSRYIHLNPYTSYIVKSLKELVTYPQSSFSEYLNVRRSHGCNKAIILDHFQNPSDYRKFVFNQAEYQRELEYIKHLTLEDR